MFTKYAYLLLIIAGYSLVSCSADNAKRPERPPVEENDNPDSDDSKDEETPDHPDDDKPDSEDDADKLPLNPDGVTRTAFVHLFEWKWNDIAKECVNVLGPAGYSAVQVSPPMEHAIVNPGNSTQSYPWYQRYQPVSYELSSRSGNEDEFKAMVATCQKSGVKIYVDAVINHLASVTGEREIKLGSAGNEYGYYSYPDFKYDDFHQCGTTYNDIHDYGNRWEVQNCELVNLADLKTEEYRVQVKISDYLAKLLSIGVAGFRIDAAKHMAAEDIRAILDMAEEKSGKKPYIFQEVIDQGGEPIKATEYIHDGLNVTEFVYSKDLSRVFQSGSLAWFGDENHFGTDWGMLPSENAVVFVDNHDNQRGHGGGGHILNYKDGDLYKQANIFMLAWPYGYPKVMSSYAFEDPSQGPPSLAGGKTKSVYDESSCGKEWICEHRWPEIEAMIHFRNYTAGEGVDDWNSNGGNLIAFSRGQKGFVTINRESDSQEVNLTTTLPPGEYCNILDKSCKDLYRVEDSGRISFSIKANSSVVLMLKEN